MQSMFERAAAFIQDLRSWGGKVPDMISVADMFVDTDCESQADPQWPSAVNITACVVE